MGKIARLHDIKIYINALNLATKIYTLVKNSKLKNDYSLIDQLKRACLSVAANIAEGYGRKSKRDFAQFLSIALGSVNEVITFLDFIAMQYQIQTGNLIEEYNNLGRQIYSFRKYLLQSSL